MSTNYASSCVKEKTSQPDATVCNRVATVGRKMEKSFCIRYNCLERRRLTKIPEQRIASEKKIVNDDRCPASCAPQRSDNGASFFLKFHSIVPAVSLSLTLKNL